MRARPYLLLAAGAMLAAAPAIAPAQTYPSQPVKMIVAFAPGGPSDVLARVVAASLSKSLGQQVIIDNKPGAGGLIGTREAARSKADGYTLLFAGDATLTVLPQLSKSAGYDPLKDFTPLRVVAAQRNVLVTNRAKGITDITSLIALAKAKPKTITFGSAGNGSPSHLIGALFEAETGVELVHVPYKGAGPAMNDLLGGQIDVMFVGTPVAVQQQSRPELAMLAVTGDKRAAELPKVSTFAEAGVKGLGTESAVWWAIVAPAGLPPDVAGKLDAAIQAVLKDPAVQNSLTAQGVEILNLGAGTVGQWVTRDHARWGRTIRERKIALE